MKINNILVPIDFSEYSIKALEYAIDFGSRFNSKLFLIHVVEPPLYPADFSMGQVVLPEVDENFVSRAEEELDSLIKNKIAGKLPTEKIVRNGKPFIEIIEAAAEKDIDLIIIATHGHTGVEYLLFGSTAEKVVRKAPCPVLTLRDPIKNFKYKGKLGKG